MHRTKILTGLMALCFAVNSFAITISKTGGRSSKTHIFVIGNSSGLGDLFLRAAQTKMLRYKSLYPKDQLILIGAAELYKRRHFIADNFGHRIIRSNRERLTPKKLVNAITRYSHIESIDFFTHSAANYGFALDEKTAMNPARYRRLISKIKRKLSSNAHIAINGCNSGFIQAPQLSKMLGIPVFGSMTSTDFQQLHNDGKWYTNNPGQYPKGGWARKNSKSFDIAKRCYSEGGCTRLKPDNHNYRGHWGAYNTGLPYYRPFCASNVSRYRCELAMVQEILLYPSTAIKGSTISEEQFKDLLVDYLCPQDRTNKRHQQCQDYLLSGGAEGNVNKIFSGTLLTCSRSKCEFATKGSGNYRYFVTPRWANNDSTQLLKDFNRFVASFHTFY